MQTFMVVTGKTPAQLFHLHISLAESQKPNTFCILVAQYCYIIQVQ